MKKPPHKAVGWVGRVARQVPHSEALGLNSGLLPFAGQSARERRVVIGIGST